MVSDMMGGLVDGATEKFDDATAEDLAKADELLGGLDGAFNGDPRAIDVDAVEAEFVRGEDLGTLGGGPQNAAASPSLGGGKSKPAALDAGKNLEFVHFGRVFRDRVRNFAGAEPLDDTAGDDLAGLVGNRAVFYRAALQREAMLLGAFAKSTQAALAAKEMEMGASQDLLSAAANLLGGGASKSENVASSTDLQPFLDKIRDEVWTPINEEEIEYGKLHSAGVALHEVRVNLRKYLRDQLDAAKNPPEKSPGLLEGMGLPMIGSIPIPGEIGDGIDFMKKVTGKLHDVQTALIFDLVLSMQPPIEAACVEASLDSIRKRRAPIYHAWFNPPPTEEEEEAANVIDTAGEEFLGGDLGAVDKALDEEVFSKVDEKANSALEKPVEIIDFLTQSAETPPGSTYLTSVFQGEAAAGTGVWLGSEFLAKKAVGTLGRAVGSGEVPGFMTGFVSTIITEVFGVCTGFLRSVYEKLCALPPGEVISAEALVEAGRVNLVSQLIDLLLEKTGLDDLLKDLSYDLPPPPGIPGVNWPGGTISAAPILAELKRVLADKARPALDPVIEYVMAGLHERLTVIRVWATPTAMTMEAHLAQLPGELAVMFRNLFGPLWELITETLMGAVNNAMQSVLGPVASAAGVPSDAFGKVTGFIDDAKNKANQAVAHAANIEDKAGKLMDALSDIELGGGKGFDDLGAIKDAGDAFGEALGADPFADGGGGGGEGPPGPTASFPGDRKAKGKGKAITTDDLEEVRKEWKWEEARPADQPPGDPGAPTEGGYGSGSEEASS